VRDGGAEHGQCEAGGVEAVRELFLDHVTPAELRTLVDVSDRVVAKLDEDPA
jgi:hypothetical protein